MCMAATICAIVLRYDTKTRTVQDIATVFVRPVWMTAINTYDTNKQAQI